MGLALHSTRGSDARLEQQMQKASMKLERVAWIQARLWAKFWAFQGLTLSWYLNLNLNDSKCRKLFF